MYYMTKSGRYINFSFCYLESRYLLCLYVRVYFIQDFYMICLLSNDFVWIKYMLNLCPPIADCCCGSGVVVVIGFARCSINFAWIKCILNQQLNTGVACYSQLTAVVVWLLLLCLSLHWISLRWMSLKWILHDCKLTLYLLLFWFFLGFTFQSPNFAQFSHKPSISLCHKILIFIHHGTVIINIYYFWNRNLTISLSFSLKLTYVLFYYTK